MGNSCCNDTKVVKQQEGYNEMRQSYRTLTKSRKDMKNYDKYKQKSDKMIDSKNQKIQKTKLMIKDAQRRLQQKITQQSETRKDMSFQIRKVQGEIESLKRVIQSEQRAIANLKEF